MDILHYLTASEDDVVGEWLAGLPDRSARARVLARIARLAAGNFGDCKPVGEGVWELRIGHGPGYRLYYAKTGRTTVLLLCGGDKRRQSSDISKAIAYWKDFQKRNSQEN